MHILRTPYISLKCIIANAEFPEEDNSSLKAALSGAAKLGIHPVCVLNISDIHGTTELLLCYNVFGVFVDENGRRTRSVNPEWDHLPFSFGTNYINYMLIASIVSISYINNLYFISAFCKPYLFIIHFSSVEIVKIDSEAYNSLDRNPERIVIELSSYPHYLGTGDSKGIYVAIVESYLELLKINGSLNIPSLNDSVTSLDTLYVFFFLFKIYKHVLS